MVCQRTSPFTHIFSLLVRPPPSTTLFPYTTLFRSAADRREGGLAGRLPAHPTVDHAQARPCDPGLDEGDVQPGARGAAGLPRSEEHTSNSSHPSISYAVFCLKKKTKKHHVEKPSIP